MALTSLVSYPNRGNFGNSNWRGNCSGKLIEDLLNFYKPKKVFDPMVGSGTTIDVCKALGVDCLGLDLNPVFGAFDALNDDVPESSDFIFWHPPYDSIIKYSGNMWGQEPDPRDLSRCPSYSDFISKVDRIELKLLSSLRKGGRLAVLVGDIKRAGVLYSIQKDMSWLGTPEQVIIKTQHNCVSDRKNYSGRFIPIVHEYLLVFRRDDAYLVPVKIIKSVGVDLKNRISQTWRDVVAAAMEKLGGKANLPVLYSEVEKSVKCKTNPNWKAKVRQILQECKDFTSTGNRGEWGFSY